MDTQGGPHEHLMQNPRGFYVSAHKIPTSEPKSMDDPGKTTVKDHLSLP